ncbi:MAG TPA: NAD-dependent epimerase/dehydratase family protein [Kofleriaceae bacterium]|nr:NAD-dependent epimerase/dehydratase family protein [Kofleriaceae bacterium]
MSILRRDLSRRDVLRGALAGAALGAVPLSCSHPGPAAPTPAARAAPRRILILGGTGFLGPKTVAAAVARGHQVTIFNRGRREKQLPLEIKVEHLYGNRDPELPAEDERGPDGVLLHPDASPKGLEQLVGKRWDVVIDNSGYYPRMVSASAQLLAKQADRYIYISSISAYDDKVPAGGDETTRLATLADPKVETMGPAFENYGGLKALCEAAAEAAFPGRTAVVRPGYIVGPGDPTDRFTYWPVRISRGGEVLAPGAPADPLQWIDVRDLADWLVTLAEHGTTGAFNAIGPTRPGRWGDVLQSCVTAAGGDARLVWVPSDWLEHNGAGGEDAFPIWVAPVGKFDGFHRWSNERAKATGLTFRTADDTVKAILAWYPGEVERRVRVSRELAEAAVAKGQPPPPGDPAALRAGPKPEDEQALLAKFKASSGPRSG